MLPKLDAVAPQPLAQPGLTPAASPVWGHFFSHLPHFFSLTVDGGLIASPFFAPDLDQRPFCDFQFCFARALVRLT